MKAIRWFAAAICAAVFCAAAGAQQPSAGPYYLGQCIKVKPGKGREFTKYAEGPLHKLMQARVASGALSSWTLTRAVLPQGILNRCDYVVMSVYPGNPPKPLGKDELNELLKKADVGMTADQYIDNRNEVSDLGGKRHVPDYGQRGEHTERRLPGDQLRQGPGHRQMAPGGDKALERDGGGVREAKHGAGLVRQCARCPQRFGDALERHDLDCIRAGTPISNFRTIRNSWRSGKRSTPTRTSMRCLPILPISPSA